VFGFREGSHRPRGAAGTLRAMTRRLVIAAVAALVAGLPSAAHAGPAEDVRDVRKALDALPLAGPDRARCLGAPNALRLVAKRIGGQREVEMLAVLASSADIARRMGYDVTRGLDVCRELTFNRSYLLGHDLPRPYGHVFEDGIIYERYPGQGMRIMPLATFEKADALARGKRTDEFLAAMGSALQIAAPRSGRLELEYLMPFNGLKPPIRSAMSAGTAIMATVRAYDATGDTAYLDAGYRFAQEVLALGDEEGDEIWFRHYDGAPWLKVLNSDLRTTYGLGFLVEATGDQGLAAVYQRSLRTILARLPRYDTGGWTRYDERRDANLNYHDLQTQLLKYLFWQSKEQAFDDWWARFKAYRAAPPRVTPGGSGPVAYPQPADGWRDEVEVPLVLTKPGRVTLTFRHANGTVAGQAVYPSVPSRASTVEWEPQPDLPAGTYTVDARVVDLVGQAITTPAVTSVQVARDTTPPQIVALGAFKKRLSWRVVDAETPWVTVVVQLKSGRRVTLEQVALRGSVRLPAKAAGATVRVLDSSGNAATRRVP